MWPLIDVWVSELTPGNVGQIGWRADVDSSPARATLMVCKLQRKVLLKQHNRLAKRSLESLRRTTSQSPGNKTNKTFAQPKTEGQSDPCLTAEAN